MSSSDFINKRKYQSMNNNLRVKTSGNRTVVQKINAIRNIEHLNEYLEPEPKTWFNVPISENEIIQTSDALIDDRLPNCNYSCINPAKIYSGGIFVEGAYDYVLCEKCNCEKNPFCLSVLKESDISENRIFRGRPGEVFKDGAYDYIQCSACGIHVDVNADICEEDSATAALAAALVAGTVGVNPIVPSIPLISTKPSDKKPVTTPFCGSCFDICQNRVYRGGEFVEGAYDFVECKQCGVNINLCHNSPLSRPCYDGIIPESEIYTGGEFVEGKHKYVKCDACGGDNTITCAFCAEPEYIPYIRIGPTAQKRQSPRGFCKTPYCPVEIPQATRTFIDGVGFVDISNIYTSDSGIPASYINGSEGRNYQYVSCESCANSILTYIEDVGIVNKSEIYDAPYIYAGYAGKEVATAVVDISGGKYKYVTCESCNPTIAQQPQIQMQFTNNYILPPEIPSKIFVNEVGFIDSHDIYFGTEENKEETGYNTNNIPKSFKYVVCRECGNNVGEEDVGEVDAVGCGCVEKNSGWNGGWSEPDPFRIIQDDENVVKPDTILVNGGVGIVNTSEIYDGSVPLPEGIKDAYDAGYKYVVCRECNTTFVEGIGFVQNTSIYDAGGVDASGAGSGVGIAALDVSGGYEFVTCQSCNDTSICEACNRDNRPSMGLQFTLNENDDNTNMLRYSKPRPPPEKPKEIFVNGVGWVKTAEIYDGTKMLPDDADSAVDAGYKYVVCRECGTTYVNGVGFVPNKEIYDADTMRCEGCSGSGGCSGGDDNAVSLVNFGFKYISCNTCNDPSLCEVCNDPSLHVIDNSGGMGGRGDEFFEREICEICGKGGTREESSEWSSIPSMNLILTQNDPLHLPDLIEPPPLEKPKEIFVDGVGWVKTKEIYDNSDVLPNGVENAVDAGYKYVVCHQCGTTYVNGLGFVPTKTIYDAEDDGYDPIGVSALDVIGGYEFVTCHSCNDHALCEACDPRDENAPRMNLVFTGDENSLIQLCPVNLP